MKRKLGFITALGIVSGVAPTVIACNTKQENPYKTALAKLISRVETVIAANPDNDSPEMEALKKRLLEAKDVQWENPTQDQKYIEIINMLTEDLNDYQHPGYKTAKTKLRLLIKDANKVILQDWEIKSPEVIDNLANAIIEAETVLNTEVECKKIIITERHLMYHLEVYEKWNWDDNHKNR